MKNKKRKLWNHNWRLQDLISVSDRDTRHEMDMEMSSRWSTSKVGQDFSDISSFSSFCSSCYSWVLDASSITSGLVSQTPLHSPPGHVLHRTYVNPFECKWFPTYVMMMMCPTFYTYPHPPPPPSPLPPPVPYQRFTIISHAYKRGTWSNQEEIDYPFVHVAWLHQIRTIFNGGHTKRINEEHITSSYSWIGIGGGGTTHQKRNHANQYMNSHHMQEEADETRRDLLCVPATRTTPTRTNVMISALLPNFRSNKDNDEDICIIILPTFPHVLLAVVSPRSLSIRNALLLALLLVLQRMVQWISVYYWYWNFYMDLLEMRFEATSI